MQNPTKNTPVSKCLDVATYSIRMFGKFSTNVVLTALAAELTTVKTHLATTQEQYESAVKEVLVAPQHGIKRCAARTPPLHQIIRRRSISSFPTQMKTLTSRQNFS